MNWTHPFVSARATPAAGVLATLPDNGVAEVEHWLRVPGAACPVSGNPIAGLLRLHYRPAGRVLEIVSLRNQLIASMRGSTSVEGLALALHGLAVVSLGADARLDLWLLVRPGPQLYRVSHG